MHRDIRSGDREDGHNGSPTGRGDIMSIAIVGWCLNVLAFILHIYFCDEDPTHEDVVLLGMMVFCVVPFMVFLMVGAELVTQKIFNYHHGVKRK